MRAKLVKIGNSQGIRLPKAIIDMAGLTKELDLEVAGDAIIIRSIGRTREGWAEAAEAIHRDGEDRLEGWDPLT